MNLVRSLPWLVVIILCLSLGLAPFSPEPHVWEKLKMLMTGELKSAVDWFDFLIHGSPWGVLLLKLFAGRSKS